MATTNTIAKVFETVLSIAGMNDNVKIQLSLSRKNVLLISKVIEHGLAAKDGMGDDNILGITKKQWRN